MSDSTIKYLNIIKSANIYAKNVKALMIWTIYDHPKDYPYSFIARAYEITSCGARATSFILVASDLNTLQDVFRQVGMSCLLRQTNDDAKIIENWL